MVDQHKVISTRDLMNNKLIGLLNNKLNLRKLSNRVETMRTERMGRACNQAILHSIL